MKRLTKKQLESMGFTVDVNKVDRHEQEIHIKLKDGVVEYDAVHRLYPTIAQILMYYARKQTNDELKKFQKNMVEKFSDLFFN